MQARPSSKFSALPWKDSGFFQHLLDHFVPHEGNNHTPHALKHRALLGYSALLLLLKVFVFAVAVALPAYPIYSSSITVQNILSLTNLTRQELGLPRLVLDERLAKAAQAKAQDMMAKQYFAHASPNGATVRTWLKAFGYPYLIAGENLAVHYSSAEDVQQGWLASPTHRANIINKRFQHIGIGISQGTFEEFQTVMVVEMFGEPPKTAETTASPKIPTPSQAVATTTKPVEPKRVLAAVVDEEPLLIDEASIQVTPRDSAYDVELSIKGAETVVLHLGTEAVELGEEKDQTTWKGSLYYDAASLDPGGDLLYVVASNTRTHTIKPLVWVSPETTVQELAPFSGSVNDVSNPGLVRFLKLRNGVQSFYAFMLLFVAASLLISIFIKFRIQRPAVISHALIVMALAFLLSK